MKNKKDRPSIPSNEYSEIRGFLESNSEPQLISNFDESEIPDVIKHQENIDFDPVIYWGHLIRLWTRHNLDDEIHLRNISDEDYMMEHSILFSEQLDFLNAMAAADLHKSVDQIKALALSMDFSKSEAFYSMILEVIAECIDDIHSLSTVSNMRFLNLPNEIASRKLSLILQVLIQQFSHLNLSKPILEIDLGPAEIVELADAIHSYTPFKSKKPVQVYRAFGRIFGNISSDDTYKNTSVKNKLRDEKAIFLPALIKSYMKLISVKK